MKNNSTYYFFRNLIETVPILKIQLYNNECIIRIDPKYINIIMIYLKNHCLFQYKVLTCISGVDYPDYKYRFEIVYDLLSLYYNHRLRIKVFTNELKGINSIENVHLSANWFECEVWDMFGVFFKNHTNLRRILTDYGFEGHPLRKDFPLSGYIEVKYCDINKRIISETVEFSQEYRIFKFFNPWN